MFRAVGFHCLFHQLPPGVRTQMIISPLGGIPRSDIAFENDSITGIQKHLRSAARRTRVVIIDFLFEDQPHVADTIANAADLPGTPATFVKCRATEGASSRLLHFL